MGIIVNGIKIKGMVNMITNKSTKLTNGSSSIVANNSNINQLNLNCILKMLINKR